MSEGKPEVQDDARLEEAIWMALELDDVGKKMAEVPAPGEEPIQMGTGATVNACYGCSNSATTAGCGTCAS